MATTSRSSKLFGDRVIEAARKHEYISITNKNGKLVPGHRFLSGHKIAWGQGTKANPNLIYVPSVRLAGTKEDILAYLRQQGIGDEYIGPFLQSAYTRENHTHNTTHIHYKWIKTSNPQFPFEFKNEGTTFDKDFKKELTDLKDLKGEKKAEGKGVAKALDYDSISRIAEQLGDKTGTTGEKRTKGRGGAKRGNLMERLEEAKTAGRFFNVTLTTPEGKGAKKADKLPGNAIRLEADSSSPFYVAFFTYKSGEEVPEGPSNFMFAISKGTDKPWTREDAKNYVSQRIASMPAASATKSALPPAPSTKSPPKEQKDHKAPQVLPGALPLSPKVKAPKNMPLPPQHGPLPGIPQMPASNSLPGIPQLPQHHAPSHLPGASGIQLPRPMQLPAAS